METSISTSQLLPTLQVLPRADKLRIVLFLISQLAQEEGIDSSSVTGNYLDWKLYDASSAANTLLNMLAEDKLNNQAPKHD
ncbi:hypothetical protein [Candidatus Parabeggiatoa sp. HSG14]|uniref:hypothetical protein n=1 Tax=Candidatus Parabeggiatoa sp. HSG14 TaxID=3055593 RepID=UPI0025A825C8|nr:hypothetical protein [Thiotrichales bacterium HSG14]